MKLSLYIPTKYRLTQGFGNPGPMYTKMGMQGHNGLDYATPTGTPLCATHDGEVVFTGEDGSGGYGVVVRTTEKFDYEDTQAYFKTIYWHCLPGSFKVKPGQLVKAGDILALSNNTGLSTGPHLHYGLKPVYRGERKWDWWNVKQNNGFFGAIDPTPYFNGQYAIDIQISLLKKLVELYSQLIRLIQPKVV